MVELEKLADLITSKGNRKSIAINRFSLEWVVSYNYIEVYHEDLETACKELRNKIEEESETDERIA